MWLYDPNQSQIDVDCLRCFGRAGLIPKPVRTFLFELEEDGCVSWPRVYGEMKSCFVRMPVDPVCWVVGLWGRLGAVLGRPFSCALFLARLRYQFEFCNKFNLTFLFVSVAATRR